MRIVRCALATVTACVLFVTAAAAQEPADTFRLREVVVTATRLQTPTAAAPGSVTVLTAEDLQARGIRFVADALRLVPGVAVMQSTGPGSQTSVFMRGGESDYVQVLVDGIQLNDAGGAFNWAHLRAEDIDRIEVVRGPASVLYGSDAVSGVIQIFTRMGSAPRVEAGAWSGRGAKHESDDAFITNAFDAGISGARVLPRQRATLRYGVSAAHLASNGLFERFSDYDNTSVSARVQLTARHGDVALTARRSENEFHYPTSGSGALLDRDQFALGAARSLAVDGGYHPHRKLELRLLATSHSTDSRTENPPAPAEESSYWSSDDLTRRKLDVRANLRLTPASVFTAGVERQWQSSTTALESVSSFGIYRDSTAHSRTNNAVYAQLHGSPARTVAATLGARIDDNDAFGTFRTARAALSWAPLAGARIHGAYGTAFKEPTFFENYATGFTRGNPELQPEEARSGEAGAEYALGGGVLVVGATWFHQRFRNLIQYTFTTPAPDAPNYYNIGLARAHGSEITLRGDYRSISYGAGWTRTRTRVIDEGFGADVAFQHGERLLRRPEQLITASIAARVLPALLLVADARHVGERDDLDFSDPEQWAGIRTVLPSHVVVDLSAHYTVLRRNGYDIDVTSRVRNAMNERYEEIHHFVAPGRVLQLGLRAGFHP